MRRVCIAVAVAIVLSCALGSAQSLPSSKTAIQISDVALVDPTTTSGGWTDLLNASIKTSEQKDLILGVSLETGLFTRTLVKSRGGVADTETAMANVQIRVLVDDGLPVERMAAPGVVTFDKRTQTMMAKFGGIMNCADVNGDGIVGVNECTFTDEELELILKTMAAHHFNFALTNLGSGVHNVKVQARLRTTTSSLDATAKAAIGKGALTVEEVRLVKDAVIIQ